MNFIFAALVIAGAAYFLVRSRTFDLFAVAFGGGAFYFLPLLVGHVPDWNGRDPFANDIPLSAGAYAIGIGFTAAVLCAAILSDLRSPRSEGRIPPPRSSLANWYLLFALVGLVGALRSGKVLDLNKTFVLTQVAYWFMLFETAAGLAWIDAFLNRRYVQLAVATAFLIFDLVVGFRMMSVMTFLACMVLSLRSYGQVKLCRKLPFLGLATVGMFLLMLTVNSFREVLLPHFGVKYTELTSPTAPHVAAQPKLNPHEPESVATGILGIPTRLPSLLEQMEPFVTQAILSETTRQNFACAPNRFQNIAFIVPFSWKLLGLPRTFEDEFKPVLFPNWWAGMAGNVWAESYCEFGYLGVGAEMILFLSALAGIQLLISRLSKSSAIPALILSGVLLAFYAQRNDLLYELLLIRRVAAIFAGAWLIEFLHTAYRARQIVPARGD